MLIPSDSTSTLVSEQLGKTPMTIKADIHRAFASVQRLQICIHIYICDTSSRAHNQPGQGNVSAYTLLHTLSLRISGRDNKKKHKDP